MIGSSDVLLERNIFRRNNVEQLTGYYPAAVKIFNQSHRVTCRDNLVIDHPHSNGIWYDVGNVDGVFVNNWVEGALDGFFFEISKGAICAGNVFVGCDKGIRVLNSSNVRVYHNTLRRHRGLLRAQREERGRRPLRLAPRAPVPTSTSARGTSSSGTCWWRASPSASPCCGSSSRRPCARSSPGRR